MIPLVVSVEDLQARGAPPTQLAFIKSPVRIGRGELNDLPLQRPFVSTYHGLVQFDDESARYVDVGSTNGSVLNGVQIDRNLPCLLEPGAELLIGTFRLTFARRVTAERSAVSRPPTVFALRASSLPARAAGGARPAAAPPGAAPAAPAPDLPPLDVAADAAAGAAIEAAALELDLQYASYRGAWEHLRATCEAALAGLEGAARRAAVERLAARYPAARAEAGFALLGGAVAAPPPAAGEAPAAPPAPPAPAGGPGAAALELLGAFGESYLGKAPETRQEIEAALGHVADVLETFGRSFVELHRGYEEFGSEMGVRTLQGEGAVHRARDATQLLAYLLDPRGEGRERELQRAFADFMLHQVALLRGVVEGGRALLARVDPDALADDVPKGLWPMRAPALWKAFEERYHELADEESALTDVLFGREFARAYAAIVGQRGGGDRQGGRGDGAREGERKGEEEDDA